MDIFQHFRASVAILQESIKLVSKNARFMALIALVSAILYSSLFLFFNSSNNSLVADMVLKQYSSLYPSSVYGSSAINAAAAANPFEAIMKDARLLFFVDITFVVGIYIVSFCTSVMTVLVSAASYNNNNSSSKNFFGKESTRNIKPALITSIYTTFLSTGYFFVFSILVAPVLMFFITAGNILLFSSVAIVTIIIALILYMYLNVEWILALVVSLMEENNYGIQGLGRAGVLINVEGKKVQGFILNLFFYILSWILSTGFMIIFGEKALMGNQTAFWVYASVLTCLIKILQLVSYTVLYFHCKKEHGEEIVELQSSVGYQKLSVQPPFSDAA